jgi:hypothetical protein
VAAQGKIYIYISLTLFLSQSRHCLCFSLIMPHNCMEAAV